MTVLALEGSPRRGGNSSLLLQWVLAGVEEGGGDYTLLRVAELEVQPCTGCDGCISTGQCILRDDMDRVLELIFDSRHLVIATPVYFYHVPAQLKALIDRFQPLWVRKRLLGLEPPPRGRLLLIGVGGTRGERLFQGIALTMNCIAPYLGLDFGDPLLVKGVDAPGDVTRVEGLEYRARELGRALVRC